MLTATGNQYNLLNPPSSGSCACPSDARLKHRIVPLTGATESLKRMRSVYYYWNDIGVDIVGKPENQREIGLIAQEVEEVCVCRYSRDLR